MAPWLLQTDNGERCRTVRQLRQPRRHEKKRWHDGATSHSMTLPMDPLPLLGIDIVKDVDAEESVDRQHLVALHAKDELNPFHPCNQAAALNPTTKWRMYRDTFETRVFLDPSVPQRWPVACPTKLTSQSPRENNTAVVSLCSEFVRDWPGPRSSVAVAWHIPDRDPVSYHYRIRNEAGVPHSLHRALLLGLQGLLLNMAGASGQFLEMKTCHIVIQIPCRILAQLFNSAGCTASGLDTTPAADGPLVHRIRDALVTVRDTGLGLTFVPQELDDRASCRAQAMLALDLDFSFMDDQGKIQPLSQCDEIRDYVGRDDSRATDDTARWPGCTCTSLLETGGNGDAGARARGAAGKAGEASSDGGAKPRAVGGALDLCDTGSENSSGKNDAQIEGSSQRNSTTGTPDPHVFDVDFSDDDREWHEADHDSDSSSDDVLENIDRSLPVPLPHRLHVADDLDEDDAYDFFSNDPRFLDDHSFAGPETNI